MNWEFAMPTTAVGDRRLAPGFPLPPGRPTRRAPRYWSLDDCNTLFQSAASRFGRVDCLVNCAAVVKSQSFLSISEKDYDFVLDVNLKGAFNLGKIAVEHFVANEGGNIVNIASVAAARRQRCLPVDERDWYAR